MEDGKRGRLEDQHNVKEKRKGGKKTFSWETLQKKLTKNIWEG